MYSGTPSVTTSISNTKLWSGNKIDDYRNMARQKVYMISGTSDSTVSVSVMNQLYKYYVTDGKFIPEANVVYKKDLKAAHTFPTDFDSTGNNACGSTSSPYVSNCGFDGAGAILSHIYGTLKPRNNGVLTGKFVQFNQAEFLPNSRTYGMDDKAWVYVPASCEKGEVCKLHIAYHGCVQGYEKIGDKYVKNTGYNRWADTNNFIILYPQAVSTSTREFSNRAAFPNMNGCWDWIGWYGNDFDVKSGKQLSAMKKMIDRITARFNPIDSPTGLAVTGTTDDSVSLTWSSVSGAAGYNLYRNDNKVNNGLITGTNYVDNGLRPGTTYSYTVKAVSSANSESSPSNVVTGKTTGQSTGPDAPSGLTLTSITSNSITLTWSAAFGAQSYKVYRNGNKVADVLVSTYVDNGLNADTQYTYQVSVVKDSVESPRSNEVTGKTTFNKVCYDDNNYNHVLAGRAYQTLGYTYANGSNQNMGLYNVFQRTNLCKTGENYFVKE